VQGGGKNTYKGVACEDGGYKKKIRDAKGKRQKRKQGKQKGLDISQARKCNKKQKKRKKGGKNKHAIGTTFLDFCT